MGKYVSFIVLGLFVSTVSLRLQATKFTTNTVTNFVQKFDELTVRNIANGGAMVALNALTLNVAETQPATSVPLYGGSYSYLIERQSEDANLGITDVRVTCIAKFNNITDTVIVLLTSPSFSRYAYFTN